MSFLAVKLIPILKNNYVFVIVNNLTKSCLVIDPGEAEAVQSYLIQNKLKLEAILITHHHQDHIAGVAKLKADLNIPVYAPLKNKSQIIEATYFVQHDQELLFFDNAIKLKVLGLPGHTLGHVAFYEPQFNWLFSGDVVFGLGCGRLFEGTFLQAFESLQTIKCLPDSTLIFCTHEYTEANLEFCKSLEKIDDLCRYEKELVEKRKSNLPSVPLLLGHEKMANPFLLANNLSQFISLRERRNSW